MDEATLYQMNESLYPTNKFPGCIDSAALEASFPFEEVNQGGFSWTYLMFGQEMLISWFSKIFHYTKTIYDIN